VLIYIFKDPIVKFEQQKAIENQPISESKSKKKIEKNHIERKVLNEEQGKQRKKVKYCMP